MILWYNILVCKKFKSYHFSEDFLFCLIIKRFGDVGILEDEDWEELKFRNGKVYF